MSNDVRQKTDKIWDDYWKLPEPRPPYFEFACAATERERFDDLLYASKYAEKPSDRLKASDIMLRHGKPTPKARTASKPVVVEQNTDLKTLLLRLATLHGIPKEVLDPYLERVSIQ
jgi:hypothetical protein